jgi:hypothetical protein
LGSNTSTPAQNVNITFPYAAFDLTASSPLVDNTTRFFPLKRAVNESQYTLGRAFFQEAYVIADYERGNFSVSACKWNSQPQNLVPILPATNGTSQSSSHSLPIGAISGIGAGGGLIALISVAIILYFYCWKPRQRRKKELEERAAIAAAQDDIIVKPELDSNEVGPKPLIPHIEIYETEGRKVERTKLEMGSGREVERDGPIYEMAAREEVAAEIADDESGLGRRRGGGRLGNYIGVRSHSPGEAGLSRGTSLSSGMGDHGSELGRPSRRQTPLQFDSPTLVPRLPVLRTDYPARGESAPRRKGPQLSHESPTLGLRAPVIRRSSLGYEETSPGAEILSTLGSPLGCLNSDMIVSPMSPLPPPGGAGRQVYQPYWPPSERR